MGSHSIPRQRTVEANVTVQPFTPSSSGSAPNKDKYPMYDIKDPTPCTLMYAKGRTLRIIEVVETTTMPSRILLGWAILAECVVVKVTTIREVVSSRTLTILMKRRGLTN
jgi:hypothetical protein